MLPALGSLRVPGRAAQPRMQSRSTEAWPGKQLTIVHSRSTGTRWISQSRPSPPHRPTASSRDQRIPKGGKNDKRTRQDILQSEEGEETARQKL